MVPISFALSATFVVGVMFASLQVVEAKVLAKANVMVLYSGDGALWGIADGLTINKHWEEVLKKKVATDPTWPFDATLEFYDVHSSDVLTDQYLKWRFANASLGLMPPVTAIMGAEVRITFIPHLFLYQSNLILCLPFSSFFIPFQSSFLGNICAKYGSIHNVPVLHSVLNPDPIDPIPPVYLNTSFLIEPPTQYQFRELINAYSTVGVKSMVAVQMSEPFNSYNHDSCFGTADLADSRGIVVKERISLKQSYTVSIRFDLRWPTCPLPLLRPILPRPSLFCHILCLILIPIPISTLITNLVVIFIAPRRDPI